MLLLFSQSRLLGTKPIIWLCDQEPVETFQNGNPPETGKLKRWLTYLSQFKLTVHHIQGITKEMADYISRNNFDALLGESSESLAKEAFQRVNVELDLSMGTAGLLECWSLRDYHAEYKCVISYLSDGLEARLIDGDRWYKYNQYLYYVYRIVVPEARLDSCLQWAHLSSGHTACNWSVDVFRQRFYSRLSCDGIRARMHSGMDYVAVNPANRATQVTGDCAYSLLYVDLLHGLPKFGRYDSCRFSTVA